LKVENLKITLNDTEIIRGIDLTVNKGEFVGIIGPNGAGKTTLTKFIAKESGVKENIVSPTFTIIKEYEGKLPFYHMDVYRIDSEDDMYDMGYDEYIYSEGVTVIEWADLIKGILPEERIEIRMKRIDDEKREISIEGKGRVFEKLAGELSNENTFN